MVPKEEVLYILTEAKSYVPLYFILFFESITEQSIHDEANYNHLGYRQQAYGKEVRSAPMHTHHPGLRNRIEHDGNRHEQSITPRSQVSRHAFRLISWEQRSTYM